MFLSPRTGPKVDFSVDETREKVARDMKEVDSVLKRDAAGLTEELYLRFGLICDYMSDTLCDYSLCSLDADKESVRKCVTVIVQDCYNVLRGEFDECREVLMHSKLTLARKRRSCYCSSL